MKLITVNQERTDDMRTKVQKTRCVKRQLTKCMGVCRTYDDVQYAGADYVNALSGVKSFECNVLLKGLAEGDYTTDFVLTMEDGEIKVFECVRKDALTRPKTAKLLEASRQFWLRRGVTDWGLIVNE